MLLLIQSHAIKKAYYILYNEKDINAYGQIFLLNRKFLYVTIEFKSISFPQSNMSRKFCHLTINKRIHVLNVHLESDFSKQNYIPMNKISQIQYLTEYANKLRGHTIIAGDCNIASDENVMFNDIIVAKFIDLNDGMLTYDCAVNTNINDRFRSRLDRILCNFDVRYQINKSLGLNPFITGNGVCFPSDHFGLHMTLRW